MARSASYDDLLMDMLKDEDRALAYLNAALDEPDPRVFLIALRNVTQAQGGIAKVAARSGLNRESLYRALSEKGNPSVQTLAAVLGRSEPGWAWRELNGSPLLHQCGRLAGEVQDPVREDSQEQGGSRRHQQRGPQTGGERLGFYDGLARFPEVHHHQDAQVVVGRYGAVQQA